jgi:DNA repair protein RecN (Recombination protein N)
MLKRIQIKDFAIIDNLVLELQAGMTVITGETGAGKSIVIDALDIALGERADSKMVRHGAEKCEIVIEFDIQHIPAAQLWLRETELANDEPICLIRRVLAGHDGRSRNFINGTQVTLQQLRELGGLLVHIHGQHQHQALVKREEQRTLLDQYANHTALLTEINTIYQEWRQIRKEIDALQPDNQQHEAQLALIRYQVEELEQLDLQPNELEQLHAEQKQLANAEHLLSQSQAVLDLLAENNEANITALANHAQQQLEQLKLLSPRLENAAALLNNALIEITEAENELRDFFDSVDINPERLQEVEHRLAQIHTMARKHKIAPERLAEFCAELQTQLAYLKNSAGRLEILHAQENKVIQQYQQIAKQLHHSRLQAATQLSQLVIDNMRKLGMPGGRFAIDIAAQPEQVPTPYGYDRIEFTVSANPGQPLQALAKVASGGELSRISLAIQVITAQADATPTLVFDEVDVGIGGPTAEIVGSLLRKLGQQAQVLCITHLPQVAAQGHHHLQIRKETVGETTHSYVDFLNDDARVTEIARMLGGVKLTPQSLAHAKEMLTDAVV